MTDSTVGSPNELRANELRNAKHTRRSARWSWLAKGTTASIGISLATGFYLYFFAAQNWNAGQITLAAHIGLGITALFLLIAWMFEHLMKGIALAKNRLFFWLSWLFLGVFAALLITGIIMAIPFFLYLANIVWFYKFETTDLIATIHLILAIATGVGLVFHLILPHWRQQTGK